MRSRILIKNCLILFLFFSMLSCKDGKIDKVKYGNCTDNTQNQNEEGVDCGGVCMPCMSCNDGIKNSTETGIDCGGGCQSCDPTCTISPTTVNYTIFISPTSTGADETVIWSYAYFSTVSSEIDVDFSGGFLSDMKISFRQGFSPAQYLALNETMVFKTMTGTNTISRNSDIKVRYSSSFSTYSGSITDNQLFYITKTGANSLLIRACNVLGSNQKDRFSISGTF